MPTELNFAPLLLWLAVDANSNPRNGQSSICEATTGEETILIELASDVLIRICGCTWPQSDLITCMKIRNACRSGFTLVEIMIVVAIIALLACIAIPNWVRARTNSQLNTCINNLRQIDAAKQQWAIETKQATNATPAFTDLSSYLKNVVTCPSGGGNVTFASSYTIGDVATKPVCQIYPGSHTLPPDSSN